MGLIPWMLTMNYENLAEAKEEVKENEDSISALIKPQDLTFQDIESWDNADIELLKEEFGMSMGDAWTYGINHPYGDMIRELAVKRFVENMQRIPTEDLNPEKFQGIEDMAVNGYWPHSYSQEEITEIVYEWKEDIEFFHGYENEVMQEVESAIIEARLEDLE